MATRLCVTVTGQTMADLRKRRDEVTNADMVELRVDTVADPDAAAALAHRTLPVIFTCRPTWEGGAFAGSEEERRRLLSTAQRLGAEYVDVEWKADFAEILNERRGQGIVLSMHDHDGVPDDLEGRATAMRATGAEVIKLAVAATRLRDCLTLLPLARRASNPTVLIAMGPAGLATRVLASRFNSAWTYAGDGVAPGQIPAERLRREFSFDRIGAGTALYGVVGNPIMHSLSPAMHNAAFAATGLDAVYLPLAAADFDDFITFADEMALSGVSVTAPFKHAAFECATARDPDSERTRSVNTLKRSFSGWDARNTDVEGFLAPLCAGNIDLQGKRVTILGAGGAARAVAYALRSAGADVAIAARRPDRAAEAAQVTDCHTTDWPARPGSWDMLVNATPIGTAPAIDDTPLPSGEFTGDIVYDLVYNPRETRLLREARAAGCRTIGGLEMLVAQAERQFEWWTGHTAPAHAMRTAAQQGFATSRTSGTLGTSR